MTKILGAINKRSGALVRFVRSACHWLFTNVETKVLDEALPYQRDIDVIIEEMPPRFMRSTQYIILALFISLLLVAALVRVDVVVTGAGRLTTDIPPILLQPLERGIIRQLDVKPGDAVTKGQVLATLDPTFAEADLGALTTQRKSVDAQLRRVEAELKNGPFDLGPSPGPNDRIQYEIYRQRQVEFNSRLHVFDEQIEQLEANLRTVEADKIMLSKQLDVTKDVEGMRAELMRLQTGSKLNYLDAEATRLRLEREYQDSVNRLVELQHDVQTHKAERQSFIDEWRGQVIENVASVRTDAIKLQEGVAKASRLNDLVVITAPEDGVVLDVAKRSVGSVMRDAEPLISIVPSHATLVADIMVASRDVGYTRPGDDVVVKVDAFPYQRHGFLEGKLLWLSEDSTASNAATGLDGGTGAIPREGEGGVFHRGRVELMETSLGNLPPGAHLFPGMTLTAEIKVDRRSVLSFFLTPITKSFSESLREP